MVDSSRTIMTDAGFALETRVRADETKMQFTRAAISTDDHFSDTDDVLAKLTELSNIQQDGKVTAVQVINTTTVYVQVDVNQAESKADYQMRSAALYAKDDDGTEVLYGVTVLQDPVFVHKDADGSYLGFGINTTVGRASNVVVVVDPTNMVTQQVFEGTMKNYYTKAEVDAKFVTDDDFASKLPKNIATIEDIKNNLPDTLADATKDNTFTGTNTFKQDPVDAAGDPYVTGAGAIAAAEGHFAKTSESGGVSVGGVELGVDDAGKLKYGDDLVLMANRPQAPGFTAEMDFSVGQPQWTVTLPKIDGGASIVSTTVQYRKNSDTDWTSIQSAVTTLSGHVTGLTGNSEYEFRAFVTNYAGDSPYSEVMTVNTMDDRIFGASWDMSSDPKLTRTDAAVGLVAGINGAQNDFDTVGPWAKMDKTITDDKGNSFVRIPKLYIKKTQTDKLATWQVSLSKIDDSWYLPKCFWDFTNQKELDYVDVGRYQGTVASGLLQSKSDVMATTSQTISVFRTRAKANGVGYQLLDIHIVDVWQVLFLIEFATLNSQSIMNGNLSGGAELKNGTGSSHAGSSGFATNTGNMDYRGIENMYGNLYQWVDGVNITSHKAWVCDDSSKYQSDLFAAPYQALNYTSSANGYISKMGYDPSHPFAQFATAVGGSDSAYYSDYQYTNSGNTSVLYGDSWNGAAGYGGAFHWNLYNAASYSSANVGSRLVRKALS